MSHSDHNRKNPVAGRGLSSRLQTYLASGAAIGAATASEAGAAIVANTNPQPFGINESVNIDFNGDGQADFQIDHDRVNLNGSDLDYLQLDKNDVSSANSPLPIDFDLTLGTVPRSSYTGDTTWDGADLTAWAGEFGSTPTAADGDRDNDVDIADLLIAQRAFGVDHNWDHGYYADCNGCHPRALTAGTSIGPLDFYDFSESDNAFGLGGTLRANRLIDEDAGQIDADAGATVEPALDAPQFTGLGGAERFIGVRIDLNDEIFPENTFTGANGPGDADDPANYNYGWIGIQITNEADATGIVTSYALETTPGMAIMAGDVGLPPATAAVPEPGSAVMVALGGATLASSWVSRKLWRRR